MKNDKGGHMSYCSWCWGKGHNSATCEQRKGWIADNPNSYEAKRESEKLERRKARKRKQTTTRKCGFCKKSGHNVKTCTLKETIYKKFTALNSVFRRRVLEELSVQGVGVGALVTLRPHNGTSDPILSIVRSIEWNAIHAGSEGRSYSIALERIGPPPEGYHRSVNPRSLGTRHLTHLLSRPMMGEIYQRKEIWERFEWQGGREMEVVSPICTSTINPPADWLSGEISPTSWERHNPLTTGGKPVTLWELKQSEMSDWAYFAGVLGLKEIHRYFESFVE
jgi:hypothetical protein